MSQTGRPLKPEGERLVPISTNVPADVYADLCRLADRRGVPLAAVVRERVLQLKNSTSAEPVAKSS